MKKAVNLSVFDKNIFTSPGVNIYSNSIYNFFYLYIHKRIDYPISIFLEISSFNKNPIIGI